MRSLISTDHFPNPQLVTVPKFEDLFQQKLTLFKEFAPDYAYFLASDPVVKAFRAITLAELQLYALANDRGLATLLTHAYGVDLDGVGQFYGILRQEITPAQPNANPPVVAVMEPDERYRGRIADAIVAFSSAGPAEHYRFHAMSADPRVKDAVVFSPDLPNFLNMGGRVSIAILSSEDNGVPSLDLMGVVRTRVQSKSVRVVSDIVDVEPAAIRPIDVVADMVLERNAAPDILIQLEAILREEFAKSQRLGWDAPRSWLTRVLSPEGVYETSLVSPATTLTVRPNQFPALNSVTLRFAGLAAEEDWQSDELAADRLLRDVHEKYITYAVATKRDRLQIQDDLIAQMRVGIVQPSLVGLAEYLGLTHIRVNGVLVPDDELAIMIHFHLSKYYERGYYTHA
jgi:phage-related baseplate assembly protein